MTETTDQWPPSDWETASVTCTAPECPNVGVAFEVTYPPGGLVLCGPCGATLIERVEKAEATD